MLADMMLAEAWKSICPFWFALLCLFHLYEKDVPKFVHWYEEEDKKHSVLSHDQPNPV